LDRRTGGGTFVVTNGQGESEHGSFGDSWSGKIQRVGASCDNSWARGLLPDIIADLTVAVGCGGGNTHRSLLVHAKIGT